MAVINRHRALVELARKGAFVQAFERPDTPLMVVCDDRKLGHLRWTTFRALIEARTLVELPRSPGQPADVTCYGLGKDA